MAIPITAVPGHGLCVETGRGVVMVLDQPERKLVIEAFVNDFVQ